MPTIEIISINSPKININQQEFEIAIIEEQKIESHRALFNDFIKQFQGTIFHLGNPYFINDKEGVFFAGQIIDWSFEYKDNFKFEQKYLPEIKKLIDLAIKSSPRNELIFLTDIQTEEGTKSKYRRFLTLDEYWINYETTGLKWNTAYLINLKPINDLQREVSSILWNDWDPIGVNDSEIYDDEYKSYVPKIIELLNKNVDIYKLTKHLESLARDSMGLSLENNLNERRIAELLINLIK